jgi:glyoxylase-like metal-dependent hydrolase (beta-lactamase superfamily II)
MRMHLLSGGRLSMPRSVYYPDAERDAWFEMPVSCALFHHHQGVALFDTGCHPDAADRGEARWGPSARYSKPIFRREDAVVGQLTKAGVTTDDIDLVICSHLHYDHCGCNALFGRATVVCQAAELEAAGADDAEDQGFLRREWDVGRPIQAIEGVLDVFGDGRLTLVPLPGHTPGSMGAHAVLDRSGAFLLASDAAPVAESLERRTAPKNSWNRDLYLASLDEIARFADDGATVLFGHDDAQWRSLDTGERFYD